MDPPHLTIDRKEYLIKLPVLTKHITFHINYIQSIASRDGFLRLNFTAPPEDNRILLHPYIKEMSFRITDNEHIKRLEKDLKDLKKRLERATPNNGHLHNPV